MNNNYIEFKKKRELGDILTDTFGFIRTNFKSIINTLIKTTGISFLALIASIAFYLASTSNMVDSIGIGAGFNSTNLIIGAVLMLITLMVFYGLMFGSILHYIKVYVTNNGVIDQTQISNGVKKDFWRIIGLGILSGLIVGFGLLLCVIPGIYVYVPITLVFTILIFRNTSVTDAIADSFDLVRNEWWITFATLLVIGIIAYIISFIFSIPALIYTFTKTFTMASEGSMSDPSSLFDWVYITLNVISSVLQYFILYLINSISSAFIYYNLNERKHNTGALEQIESLGKS